MGGGTENSGARLSPYNKVIRPPIISIDTDEMPQHLVTRVCLECKTRKKRCDKRKPQCTACKERGYECQYESTKPPTHTNLGTASQKPDWVTIAPAGVSPFTPSTIDKSVGTALNDNSPLLSVGDKADIHRQVYRLIESTGQYIDDITSHYFKTIHQWLPVISRRRFQSTLVGSAAAQSAEFSILLLTICLVTYRPSPGSQQPSRRSLYVATTMLFIQAQAFNDKSINLIRANLLCAVFEYAQGRVDTAYVTIGNCARMAHIAGIHKEHTGLDVHDPEVAVELQERRNLLWAIFIIERAIICEIGEPTKFLSTPIQPESESLPVEAALLDSSHVIKTIQTPSSLASNSRIAKVRVFGRQAQAACLLDRVLDVIEATGDSGEHSEMSQIDAELRAFISSVMDQASETQNSFCGAIAIAIRALFLLHSHNLHQSSKWTQLSLDDEGRKSSRIAIDTFTKVAVDIAHSHTRSMHHDDIDVLSPSCMYMFRVALEHLNIHRYPDFDTWTYDCNALRFTLDLFDKRWAICNPHNFEIRSCVGLSETLPD